VGSRVPRCLCERRWGRLRGAVCTWTPRRPAVGAVARRSECLGASATGGGLSRSDKLHATGASAARSARPGRATTRLMRPPPFAVGSGRRTSGGGRAPAVVHQQAVGRRLSSFNRRSNGGRLPSLGERPAVSTGTPGAAPYAGEKSGSCGTDYSRVHPGRTHAYRGRSGTWWSKAVRETGVSAQRRGAATAGTTATRQPPDVRAPTAISLEKTTGAKGTRSGFTSRPSPPASTRRRPAPADRRSSPARARCPCPARCCRRCPRSSGTGLP